MARKISKTELIDLSRVVSKYIGETEKNLHQILGNISAVKSKVSELMRILDEEDEEETTGKS